MADVNVGGGRLEMDTDGARAGAAALTQAGTDFANALKTLEERMRAAEPGIGTNSGAAEFRQQYEGTAVGMKESAGNVQATFNAFATSVTDAATQYEEVDRKYQEEIRRTSGG
jgi:hypothetical protein